jgi:methylmalonyl-CoA/ethylmalonyl-CoA epimerase
LRNSSRKGARLAHIGIAVRDIDALMPFYSKVLGMDVLPMDDSDGARISGLSAGDALVELLEPAVDESPIGKFIAKRGPGIHHVCFIVDDLAAVLERCRAAGIRLIDEEPRIGAEGKPIAFLHPSSTGGVLIELTEQ